MDKLLLALNLSFQKACGRLRLISPLFTDFLSKFMRRGAPAFTSLMVMLSITINGLGTPNMSVSPIASPLQSLTREKISGEVFSFAPGGSDDNLNQVNLEGLDNLAYFDIPVTGGGDFIYGSTGYTNLYGFEAANLFERAKSQGTKVLLTLTPGSKQALRELLDNPNSQQNLFEQAIWEMKNTGASGVAINFEFKSDLDPAYRDKFTRFVEDFTQAMHESDPDSKVAVVIPTSQVKDRNHYDVKALSAGSDQIFMVASDFAVPEYKTAIISPIYGSNENNYWSKVSISLHEFLRQVPKDKLVVERAWYGNGSDYPLYKPESKPVVSDKVEPSDISLDQRMIDQLVQGAPAESRDSARKAIPIISKALEQEGILDSNVLAYALATIEHETDATFEPVEEIQGRVSARRFGYEGGTNYFGRGYIQLTHLRNYRMFGERIGMGDRLVENPDLATSPEIAAKILAAYFKDNNVAYLASQGQFVAARTPINPDSNGWRVANLAYKYLPA